MINGFLRKWRSFLTEGNLEDYSGTGQVTLYHYSGVDTDTIMLDPKYFLSNRSSFSRREYEKSQVPRTFFYVDTSQAERMVSSGKTLYTTTVPSSEIYNLKQDPEGILEASKQSGAFFIDYNKVFNTIKQKYKGVFYDTGGFDVVAWFEPIQTNKEG